MKHALTFGAIAAVARQVDVKQFDGFSGNPELIEVKIAGAPLTA
jgi:hypothetical protein